MGGSYSINVEYREPDRNHVVSETWSGLGLEDFKKTFVEHFDVKNAGGEPVMPDIDELRANLGRFIPEDDEFIEAEFERMKKGYELYNEIMSVVEGMAGIRVFRYDENTSVTVSRDA